jgi:NADPH:quinone reductase-like Zn-dependent oxidoreductase
VGTFVVQLATAFGAEVTATTRTENLDLVRSLGADRVIDYTREDFTRSGQRYDLLFDLVANRSLSDCRRALTPEGTLIRPEARAVAGSGPSGSSSPRSSRPPSCARGCCRFSRRGARRT